MAPRTTHLRPNRLVHSLLSKVLRWLVGVFSHVDVVGLDHVPRRGGAVLVCNHRSLFDAVALGAALDTTHRDVMVLAKSELFERRLQGRILRRAGVIPVFRGTDRAKDSMAEGIASLQHGELVVVFPEGTIPKDGQLMEFKTGAVRMAKRAGVPVIPLVLVGTDQVIATNVQKIKRTLFRRVVQNADITVVVGRPLTLDRDEEIEAVTRDNERVRAAVLALLEEHDEPRTRVVTKRGVLLSAVFSVPVLGALARLAWKRARS
ncbi:1-acyl-sn-glycerol-3-phosphate acyltransferase [Nocardioides sp.]|uniref:1-acyl-sn-glycerol-3-phosphate acyltransferase n=1 Tax=Nocardioides sp. TaxID=35761 RepID=UPI0027171A7A|nr:1-acyl-sn-glycerol-3-phosphate acyltransferase [Nocardioides sp.]MDO9455729.1 1-acyl-sn-glycerol-3-phosphate acyltransferase [Nocardioides sp.]